MGASENSCHHMRKIISFMHISLDGFVAGPNGEMDWIVYKDDLENYVHALHTTTDTAIAVAHWENSWGGQITNCAGEAGLR